MMNTKKIMKKCVWMYNAQVSVCFGIIGILVMSDVDAMLKKERYSRENVTISTLPFINWLPFEYVDSPMYEISFILINYWFFIAAVIIIMYDTICMGLMIQIVGQLKILRFSVETLRPRAVEELKIESTGNNLTDDLINEKVAELFKKCVVHHQLIIKNIYGFQRIFSTMIFLQYCISCLMVCFTILIATSKNSLMSTRVTCIIILACSMWELSVYCYFGNEIIVESSQLSTSIYLCDWYIMDMKMMRNISIMMMRAQKPIIFKAGGFVPLSLYTFITVLKAAYSYYTFLSKFANK